MDIDETKIRRLDFTLLLVFRELVRHRRTTVAAAHLNLSQSAVSHALARLRTIFDEPLFIRLANGLQPTRAALALAPKVDALLGMAGGLLQGGARFDPASSERHFRVAANDFVTSILTPDLTARLRRLAPATRTSVSFAVGAEALEALRGDAVDLALGRFRTLPEEFEGVWLADEPYVVAAPRRHPAIGAKLDLRTYLKLDHVLVSFHGDLRGTADEALERMGRRRRVVASVPMFLTALAVAAEGGLLVTVPARLGRRHAAAFGLKLYPVPFPIEPFAVTAVRHRRAMGDEGLRWLVEAVRGLWSAGKA